MTNEITLIQVLLLSSLLLFNSAVNILVLWYLAGFYLFLLGFLLLLNDGDIFVGFLWVIDLGVGLVFFIFILHYSSFLHQKVTLNKSNRELSLFFIFLLSILSFFNLYLSSIDPSLRTGFNKTWIFTVNWLDYYQLHYSPLVTDLNLLREIYLVNNSFEFIAINFFLFYGIVSSILLSFLVKYIFTKDYFQQFSSLQLHNFLSSTFFIRNQNFIKQNSTSAGERIWVKKRFSKIN